ncbi:pregnancy-specific beta-1-glycoprotein 1-like [Pygocentrus nattereri]|uniref:pregnancy-specific beta-1-glycoprotein 1-like n=1 Tax=Pygocentrus nattereri TaxID=42514 RepID=UPI0018916398|nr:pregnancy-specific beta-1-glycoprotein 1-like [Pygocentrus nattereri]
MEHQIHHQWGLGKRLIIWSRLILSTYTVSGLLCSAGEEVVRLQELEGNTVTIHTGLTGVQSDAHILWFYGPENADIKIVNSQIIRGEIITDYYSERLRDRLQLNRTSGSLTIRNISREDSGVYKLHIITGSISVWSFSVDVYAPVSKPIIRNQKRSMSLRESCSPLCSVENGKDVSLSWYEEKERISSISSSDSSERLYLPLNKTNPDCSTYTCVAANPVSTQTTQLNITELCYNSTEGKPCSEAFRLSAQAADGFTSVAAKYFNEAKSPANGEE